MYFYKMTIIEETDSEYRNELTLWDTDKGKIWMQIGEDDINDPLQTQGMAITVEDARALINELSRLIKQIDGFSEHAESNPGKQLVLTPEQPVSKVNWSK